MPNETKKSPDANSRHADSGALSTRGGDIHPPADTAVEARTEPRVISVRGAREHNLADVSIDLPRDRLVVLTGLSGSGKSSLAFDTIYAEGQRRYVESLSAYARQFLEMMQSRMWTLLKDCHPPSRLNRKQPRAIRARPSVP